MEPDSLKQAIAELTKKVESLQAAQTSLDGSVGEAPKKLAASMEAMQKQIVQDIGNLLVGRDAARKATEKQNGLRRIRAARSQFESEFTKMLELARATWALVERARGAAQTELRSKYRLYMRAVELAGRARQLTEDVDGGVVDDWASPLAEADAALRELRAILVEISDSHRTVSFCVLLDETDRPEMRAERARLMDVLGVEEDRPRVNQPVTDTTPYDLVRVIGDGEQARILEVVAPGYRMRQRGDVLQKPKVVIEQRP